MMSDESRPAAGDDRLPTMGEALIGAAIGVAILVGGLYLPIRWLRWLAVGLGIVWVAVMLAYVVALEADALRAAVTPIVKRLRGHVTIDPRLGRMLRDARAGSWVATPIADDRSIEFHIDGDATPDAHLLAQAREAAEAFQALRGRVAEFLTAEAAIDAASDPELASEVRALRISGLVFRRDRYPHTFLIDLEGPDEEKFWTCECTDGRLVDLDFD